MSYDFLGDIDRIGMDAYKQGEEDAKKRAIEILASVLENWVHGGDADCIIAEFEEELMKNDNDMAQFTTQVATSIEQSQQLIELGVKPETADLVYRCTKSSTDSLEWELQLCPPSLENIDNNDIPAWSLVRLLELLPYEIPCDRPNVLHHPELIKYEDGYNFSVCRYTVDCFAGTPIENSPFDSCVSMIKWLIAKGYFSKEFCYEKNAFYSYG